MPGHRSRTAQRIGDRTPCRAATWPTQRTGRGDDTRPGRYPHRAQLRPWRLGPHHRLGCATEAVNLLLGAIWTAHSHRRPAGGSSGGEADDAAATPAPSHARIRPDCRSAGSPPADHAGLLSAARGQVDGREPSFEHRQDHAGAAFGHEEAGQRLRTQFRAPTGQVAVAKNASSRSWRSPPRPTTTAGSSRCWRTWASDDHPRRSIVVVLPPHGSRAAMVPFGSRLRGAAAPSP